MTNWHSNRHSLNSGRVFPTLCWGAFGGRDSEWSTIRTESQRFSQPATIKSTCLVANTNRPEDSVFPVSPHHTVVHTTKNNQTRFLELYQTSYRIFDTPRWPFSILVGLTCCTLISRIQKKKIDIQTSTDTFESAPGRPLALRELQFQVIYLALFFSNAADLMDFQPYRVFVEYRRQFVPVFSENRTVLLALEIRIDWYRHCRKRIEFVRYSERTLFILMWYSVHEIACSILNYRLINLGLKIPIIWY